MLITSLWLNSVKYIIYYDATNEKGLSIAGLNFPITATYCDSVNDKNMPRMWI